MSTYFVCVVRVVAVVAVTGLLTLTSGCKGNKKVAEAQSPPPSSLSAPVRVEQPATPQPASVTVVPASQELAFLKDRQAPVSRPLPSVTPPPRQPDPMTHSSPEALPEYYVMKKGDTIYAIARKYNIPPKQLIAANNFPNPNVLPVGTKVRLP